jgi:hypothetical protein
MYANSMKLLERWSVAARGLFVTVHQDWEIRTGRSAPDFGRYQSTCGYNKKQGNLKNLFIKMTALADRPWSIPPHLYPLDSFRPRSPEEGKYGKYIRRNAGLVIR